MVPYDDDGIANAREEETRRGSRRRTDREGREQARKLCEAYLHLLRESDEKRFTGLLRERGWTADSPEYRSLLATWREYRRGRRP